ncbi:hypothetical protein [Kutzneria sp. NPDC052558]|uniref:hypothetical protein n=1 Tax=Kutzneria sp. NPDC052558 TaxID=3364121 RepID=UPI0037CBE997
MDECAFRMSCLPSRSGQPGRKDVKPVPTSTDNTELAVGPHTATTNWWDRNLLARRAVLVMRVLGRRELAAITLNRSILPTLSQFVGAIGDPAQDAQMAQRIAREGSTVSYVQTTNLPPSADQPTAGPAMIALRTEVLKSVRTREAEAA